VGELVERLAAELRERNRRDDTQAQRRKAV
jgi:hypothetical protein